MDIQGPGPVIRQQVPVAAPNPPEPAATPAAAPPAAPLETSAAPPPAASTPDLSQVKNAVQNINKVLRSQNQGVEFSLDDNHVIVKVVDQNTGEVLRQIPSEEAIEISKAIETAQQGLLIQQQA